eukprot:853926-Amphidinium_carterae.1
MTPLGGTLNATGAELDQRVLLTQLEALLRQAQAGGVDLMQLMATMASPGGAAAQTTNVTGGTTQSTSSTQGAGDGQPAVGSSPPETMPPAGGN